jgi:hypothetical protein
MIKFHFILCLFFYQFLLAQNDTASVSKPKLGVISVDKLNVVYRGIQNPISIAVPNAKSFTVSGLGVTCPIRFMVDLARIRTCAPAPPPQHGLIGFSPL